MTIGVTGATGQLGRIVIEKLKARVAASEIVALVRNPEKARDLGVAARSADYSRPQTLDAAFAGIDTLLLISSSEVGQRAGQHANVIDAAKKERCAVDRLHERAARRHVAVEPGGRAPRDRSGARGFRHCPHAIAERLVHRELRGAIPGALANGAFVGSAGEGRIASASREDYAEAAVAVLAAKGQEGKTYELAGDSAWTLAELAAEISRKTGRTIPYVNLPEAEYAAVLQKVGLPEGIAQAVASWDVGASQGALFHEGRELSQLIGRPTTPMADTVAAVLERPPPQQDGSV